MTLRIDARRVPVLPGARERVARRRRAPAAPSATTSYLERARRLGRTRSTSIARSARRSADVGRTARRGAAAARVADYLSRVAGSGRDRRGAATRRDVRSCSRERLGADGAWWLPQSSKLSVTRPRRVGWVRFPHAPATHAARASASIAPCIRTLDRGVASRARRSSLAGCVAAPGAAQPRSGDSARAGVAPAPIAAAARSVARPQLRGRRSPRKRAFLYSLLVPGYGAVVARTPERRRHSSSRRGDRRIAMLRRVRHDRPARRRAARQQRFARRHRLRHATGRRRSRGRRSHARGRVDVRAAAASRTGSPCSSSTISFAGADAYVAAHLWDLPRPWSASRPGRTVAAPCVAATLRMVTAVDGDAARPIGVFDSGIGGLTVVRELMRQLPDESIIYFGDTARVPYGPKSPDTVRRYSREIAASHRAGREGDRRRLQHRHRACARRRCSEEFPLPVIGVVEPGARAAVRATRSRPHRRHRHRRHDCARAPTSAPSARSRPDADVDARACPLFVPLVEEGWLESEATRLIAQRVSRAVRRGASRHARARLHALSAAQAAARRDHRARRCG